MYTLLLVINVVCAVVMVVVILLQHGQGAAMGSAFGKGTQGSLLGVSGSANFLSRATSILAVCFFSSALALSIVSKGENVDPLLEELAVGADKISVDRNNVIENVVDEVPTIPIQGELSGSN